MRVTNIARVVDIARRRGIRAPSFHLRDLRAAPPLDLGADVTVYATTEYVAARSDVVNGLTVFREQDELYERAHAFQINVGLTPSPFDCSLVHAARRAPLPHGAHSQNAQAIASFLKGARGWTGYYPARLERGLGGRPAPDATRLPRHAVRLGERRTGGGDRKWRASSSSRAPGSAVSKA